MGKDKKNKKVKQEEEEVAEEVVEETVEEVEAPVKKSKKDKKAKKEPEPEPEEEAEAEEEAQEEATNGDSEYQLDQDAVNAAVKQLQEVSSDLVNTFRKAAQAAVKKFEEPVNAVAAALAVMTGATKVVTTSILTNREGFTTYQLTKYDDEIRGKSFAFVIIKRILGEEEGDAAVSHLKFTQDRKVDNS